MLTTVSFPSLRLGRLTLRPTLDSSASLIGGHVVQLMKAELESGTFLVGQDQLQDKVMLQHSIETEEMMELST